MSKVHCTESNTLNGTNVNGVERNKIHVQY